MVDDEEIRNNRLSLLRQISSLLENALNTNEIALD